MDQNLSITCRPKRLDMMVGTRGITDQIRNQIANGRIPKVWLFIGEPGSGKTTIARIIAVSLQCKHVKEFGEPCIECIKKYDENSFSITEQNVPDNNGIDDARALVSLAGRYPLEGDHRIIILDEVHKTTEPAQTVLLKSFEEESSNTIWILCTTNPAKLLPAIKRRCLTFVLPGVNEDGLAELVTCVNLHLAAANQPMLPDKVSDKLIIALKANGITSPGLAVMAMEKCLAGASPEEAAQPVDLIGVNVSELWQAVVTGDWIKTRGILNKANTGDGKAIRSVLANRFKWLLLQSDGKRAMRCANAIHELSLYQSWEDGLTLSSTAASIYKICSMIVAAKKEDSENAGTKV